MAKAAERGFHPKAKAAALKANIKMDKMFSPRIRSGIGPKPRISLGKWQSGPSLGTPRGREDEKKT